MVDVDAMLPALQQTRERAPEVVETRDVAAHIADSDECWWIHRARVLGLMSIEPVEPWPRDPARYIRPPGYLHNYGPEPPLWYLADLERLRTELEQRENES